MSIATTVYKTQATGNDFVMFEDADGTFDINGLQITIAQVITFINICELILWLALYCFVLYPRFGH